MQLTLTVLQFLDMIIRNIFAVDIELVWQFLCPYANGIRYNTAWKNI